MWDIFQFTSCNVPFYFLLQRIGKVKVSYLLLHLNDIQVYFNVALLIIVQILKIIHYLWPENMILSFV